VPNAKHITNTNSRHEIHKEQPQLVIDAIPTSRPASAGTTPRVRSAPQLRLLFSPARYLVLGTRFHTKSKHTKFLWVRRSRAVPTAEHAVKAMRPTGAVGVRGTPPRGVQAPSPVFDIRAGRAPPE
jgi:hypothetical protein